MNATVITGGAGFIGGHLVRRLVDFGECVRVVEKPGTRTDHLPPVEVVFADIRDRESVRRSLADCGRVYHLAANPQLWTRRRGDFDRVNHLGTVHVLEEALRAGSERILHVSTESILTLAEQTIAIAEDQHVRIGDVIGPYCRSKYRAERFALSLGRSGHPVVVVNPTLPIGPGDRNRSPPTQMMLDFCRGKRAAYLDAELNMIDVRDVAEGMVRAMEVGVPGRRYLLGAEDWSVKRVFDHLAAKTGLPEPEWRVPYPVALAAAYVSEFVADVMTGQTPAATVTGVKLTRRVMRFDASRTFAELGIEPRPVAGAIDDAVAWFREVGWVNE